MALLPHFRNKVKSCGISQFVYKDLITVAGLSPNCTFYNWLIWIGMLSTLFATIGLGTFVHSGYWCLLIVFCLEGIVCAITSDSGNECYSFCWTTNIGLFRLISIRCSKKYSRYRNLIRAVYQYNAWVISLSILRDNNITEPIHWKDLSNFLEDYKDKLIAQFALDRAQREGEFKSKFRLEDAPPGYDNLVESMKKFEEDKDMADIMKELGGVD